MLICHERQLRRVLAEYEAHYNTHRRHRALDQRPPITGFPILFDGADRPAIRRVEVLGGLINEYRARCIDAPTKSFEVIEPHTPW